MINNKSQLEKRIKWLRITLYAGTLLVVSHLVRLIFYPEDSFRIFMDGLFFVLYTGLTVSYLVQLKKARKNLQEVNIEFEPGQF